MANEQKKVTGAFSSAANDLYTQYLGNDKTANDYYNQFWSGERANDAYMREQSKKNYELARTPYTDTDYYNKILSSYGLAGDNAAYGALSDGAARNGGNVDSYASAQAKRQEIAYQNAAHAASLAQFNSMNQWAQGQYGLDDSYLEKARTGKLSMMNQYDTKNAAIGAAAGTESNTAATKQTSDYAAQLAAEAQKYAADKSASATIYKAQLDAEAAKSAVDPYRDAFDFIDTQAQAYVDNNAPMQTDAITGAQTRPWNEYMTKSLAQAIYENQLALQPSYPGYEDYVMNAARGAAAKRGDGVLAAYDKLVENAALAERKNMFYDTVNGVKATKAAAGGKS